MTSSSDYVIHADKTFLETKEDIALEFRRWGVTEFHVRRGSGRGDESAAVEWYPAGSSEPRFLESRDQAYAKDNLRKLFLIIQALRKNELRGFADQMRAFYLQLPAGKVERDPYEVLGASRTADLDDIEALYKIKAQRLHPDKGGTAEAMAELNAAMDRIRQERAG